MHCLYPGLVRKSICKPLMILYTSSPVFCATVVTIYLLTFVVILPFTCHDWAYSMYMSHWVWKRVSLVERAFHENDIALSHAKEYLSERSGRSYIIPGEGPVDFAVAVVTVKRLQSQTKTAGYLTRVVAGLDQAISDDTATSKAFFICNVYAGPGPHSEAEELHGKYHFPVIARFPNGSVSASIMDRFVKEKEDYMFCMEEAMRYTPSYVLIVEDDALPKPRLFTDLQHLIMWIEHKPRSSADKQWAFLKLYYPERWQGYGSDLKTSIELIGLACIGGSITVALFLVCSDYRQRFTNPAIEKLVFVCGSLYLVLLALVVGRPYLLELRRLSPHLYTLPPAADCCSPSILFPKDTIPLLLPYLNSVTIRQDFAIDMALDNFVRITNHEKYAVEPNLFKHLGLISTIKGISRHPEQYLYLT